MCCLLFLALFSKPAFSQISTLTAYLITVGPGSEIFSAFGHTALEIDEDGNSETENTVYEYGGVILQKLFLNPNPLHSIQQILDEKILANTIKQGSKLFENRYKRLKRTLIKERLKLTNEQILKLKELIEQDFSKKTYEYKNLTDNCTTRIRDHILAVVDENSKNALTTEQVALSLRQIAIEAMNETAQLNGVIRLIPKAYVPMVKKYMDQNLATTLHPPLEVTSGDELYSKTNEIKTTLSALLPEHPITVSLESYTNGPEITEKPISKLKTLFTPQRLREALKALFLLEDIPLERSLNDH